MLTQADLSLADSPGSPNATAAADRGGSGLIAIQPGKIWPPQSLLSQAAHVCFQK